MGPVGRDGPQRARGIPAHRVVADKGLDRGDPVHSSVIQQSGCLNHAHNPQQSAPA